MRPWLTLVAALALATAAEAGPSVSRRLVEALPAEVHTASESSEADVATLDAAIVEKAGAAERARGDVRALKLEIKAIKARIKADKAERKAAKKAGDDARASTARDRATAGEGELAAMEARLTSLSALISLLDAQHAQLEAQRDLREADLQLRYAQAVNEHVEPLDDAAFRAGRAKADLAYQKARANTNVAEARYSTSGGTEIPASLLLPELASPTATPTAPAPTP
jgi:phage shock protein A